MGVSGVDHLAETVELAKKLVRGATYYRGSPCHSCGSGLRYIVNRACVGCTRRKAQATTQKKKDRKRADGLAALRRLGLR